MALKSLPNNLEAEESVLGACFLSKYALQKACESLSEESFYSEKNAKIFASLSSLMDKKIPIDLTTVTVYWYLCPYGKPKSPVLVLDSKTKNEKGETKIVINEGEKNLCYVNLSVEDTKNMTYVKYTQQPVIVLTNSRGTRRYIRAEGNIIFKPMIEDKKLNSDMNLFRFFK